MTSGESKGVRNGLGFLVSWGRLFFDIEAKNEKAKKKRKGQKNKRGPNQALI